MSSEPERPIEKLLRASAKERRDQAGDGWEVHPATRRILQGEVARRFGHRPDSRPGWLGWLLGQRWARPIGALVALGLIVAAIWMSVQGVASKKPEQLLAKNDHLSSPAAERSAVAPAETDRLALRRTDSNDATRTSKQFLADNVIPTRKEESPPATLNQMELAKDKEARFDRPAEKAKSFSAPPSEPQDHQGVPSAAENSAAPLVAAQAPPVTQRYGLAAGLPPSPVASPMTSNVEPTIAGANKQATDAIATGLPAVQLNETPSSNLGAALNLLDTNVLQYGNFVASQIPSVNGSNFRQLRATEALARSKATAQGVPQAQSGNQILVSFRVEQSGRELRVIDQDGSVYAGPIQTEGAGVAAAFADERAGAGGIYGREKVQASAAAPRNFKSTQQSAAASVFQVVGTNRSSNQRVIFSGTLSGATNAPVTSKTEPVTGRIGGAVQLLPNAANQSLQNARVSGRAVIGTGQVVDIEAAAVPGQ